MSDIHYTIETKTTPRMHNEPVTLQFFFEAEMLRRECNDLPSWTGGTMHKILVIHEYMKRFGGCTASGRIYWREEEKQVANIMLRAYAPSSDRTHPDAGVGESTLLVVMAFYLALVEYKNVYLVRTRCAPGNIVGYGVVFMGFVGSEMYHFSKSVGTAAAVADMRGKLELAYGKLYLLLDCFEVSKVPDGLRCFQVDTTVQFSDVDSSWIPHLSLPASVVA